MYWTVCVVDVCEPEREFTFTVLAGSRRVNTWSYRLEAIDSGTRVTESFRLAQSPVLSAYWALFGRWRRRTNVRNMTITLERIRAVVEAEGNASA